MHPSARSLPARPVFLPDRNGFTLFEALLALLIFSVAIVSLIQAINTAGHASLEARRELSIQLALDAHLLEITRKLLPIAEGERATKNQWREADVLFESVIEPLDLQNKDGETLTNLYAVTIRATWKEANTTQQAEVSTWVYPPFHAPLR